MPESLGGGAQVSVFLKSLLGLMYKGRPLPLDMNGNCQLVIFPFIYLRLWEQMTTSSGLQCSHPSNYRIGQSLDSLKA